MAIRTQFGPFSIIVGVDEVGGFAKDGKIPWIDESFGKEDLRRFQQITTGNICIMGRRTYNDLLALMLKRRKLEDIDNILPKRQNFVVTSRGGETPGAQKVLGLRDAIHELEDSDRREIFVLGGYRMFVEAFPFVNKVYMTIIPGIYNCDSQFPINSLGSFRIVEGKKQGKLKFITYQRIK